MNDLLLLGGGLGAALLLTSFLRLLVALNVLRYGLGLTDLVTGIAVILVSLTVSLAVNKQTISSHTTAQQLEQEFRPRLEGKIDPVVMEQLRAVATSTGEKTEGEKVTAPSFDLVIGGYVLSELKSAFAIGVMLLLPFVLIDLIVAHALTALGMLQLNVATIALPLKLLLFVTLDGWSLVIGKILSGGIAP